MFGPGLLFMHPKSREIIKSAVVALDDWILTYAPEWCDPEHVRTARERIYNNGGTLSYVATLREQLEHVLKNEN